MIPTTVDRVLQQAIAQVLSPIFEPQFVETSYGFRPKRSAHDALKKLGLDHNKAIMFACTRKGYWRIANSHILTTTFINARLKQAGYTFFSDYYKTVAA